MRTADRKTARWLDAPGARNWARARWIVPGLLLATLIAGAWTADAGILEVRIHDHREALADFLSVVVTIPTVGLHPAGLPRAGGWRELPTALQRLDLTQHTAANPVTIVRATLEPGAYDAIRLEVKEIRATGTDGRAIPVVWATGAVAARFSASPGRLNIVTLDLTVIDMSDHPPKGYELHVKTVSVSEGTP
jgi:hypothetical protein